VFFAEHSAAELLGQFLHFLEYTVLAFLVYRALNFTFPSTLSYSSNLKGFFNFFGLNSFRRTPDALIGATAQHLNTYFSIFIASLFAFSDEIHQLFVPGRAFQLIDLIIDFIGILFGVFLYTRLKIEPQRHEDSIPPG
jgi:hypothetical protein